MQKQNIEEANRFEFPIDLFITLKASGGAETFRKLRDFMVQQTIIHLDEEFLNDPEIREEWQEALNILNNFVASLDRHQNTDKDQDIVETVKFLQTQQKALAEQEVSHG